MAVNALPGSTLSHVVHARVLESKRTEFPGQRKPSVMRDGFVLRKVKAR